MTAEVLHIQVLGATRAWRGPHPLDLGPAKQRLIFARLALHANEPVPLNDIVRSVWQDDPPAKAPGLVHTYIAKLRRLLEPNTPPRERTNVIALTPRGYQLMIDPTRVDILRFRALTGSAERLFDDDPRRAFDLLGEAVRLWDYNGPPDLDNVVPGYDLAQVLRVEYVQAALQYIMLGLADGKAPAVLPMAERLAVADPLHEPIQALYIRALAATGQRAAAVAWYGDVRARLRTDLGVDPASDLSSAYRDVLATAGEPLPASGLTMAHPTRPPWRGPGPAAEELIGRDTDAKNLRLELNRQRLITLTGAPGSGKTALARGVCREIYDSFAGGSAIVDLSAAETEADVRRQILQVLRMAAPEADGAWLSLLATLADQHLLLIFDNADSVIDGCWRVVDEILRCCPSVAAVITSREILGLPYETIWPVRPLVIPPARDLCSAERTTASPAVELFLRRAAQARPGLMIQPLELPLVAAICRRLDGLPLAIELAAGSLRTMELRRLVPHAADGLRRLAVGRRGVPPQQRSMADAIQWSYDRIGPHEQRCLLDISALGRTFSIDDAIAAIRRRPGIPFDDARRRLDVLVDTSFLYVEHSDEQTRYRMVEPIRVFARQLRSNPAPTIRP